MNSLISHQILHKAFFFESIKSSPSKGSKTTGQCPRGDLSYHEFHYQNQLTLWMVECNIKDSGMVSGDSTWRRWERERERQRFLTRCTFSEPKFNIWYDFSYNPNKSPGTKGQNWIGLLLVLYLYLKFWIMLVQRLYYPNKNSSIIEPSDDPI